MRRTLCGRAVLAAAAALAVLSAATGRAQDGLGEAPRAPSAVDDAFAGLDRATLRRLALAAGPVRVRGRAHLAGRVFAQDFRVEPGAEVTIAAGTSIYSVGDIRIDAPIRGVAPPARRWSKTTNAAARGDAGASTPDITFVCEQGDFVQSETILMADGGDGECVSIAGTSGQGGPGGKGGGIRIECPGTVTILANVVPGRGGRGGCADVVGNAGAPGRNGQSVRAACGGAGGNSGDVRIVCHKLVFETDTEGKLKGKIALRPGGVGGDANARGGDGGDAAALFKRGGHGGDAIAKAGKAGRSTRAFIQVDELEPADVDAHDIAGFLETEHADGGAAKAIGGKGGGAIGIFEFTECFFFGRNGGKGGFGGSAVAYGGFGGTGGQIGGGSGALRDRAQSAAETPPGNGGDAEAHGGDAGTGGIGESAGFPGRGGAGGNGGDATARGGPGGSSTLGERFDQPLVGGQGPLTGGAGGSVTAIAGTGTDGGTGGSCCDHPGGRGAAGGSAGAGGIAKALQGRGGLGFTSGPIGAVNAQTPGADGAPGAKGADCPAPCTKLGEVDIVVSPNPAIRDEPSTFTATVRNTSDRACTGLLVQIYDGNTKLGEKAVDIPAKSDDGPGVATFSLEQAFSKLETGHTAEVRIGGFIVARASFDIVKPPCAVTFSTNELDFGHVPANTPVCQSFDVTNPSDTATATVVFPPTTTGEVVFDPQGESVGLTVVLAPGETLHVQVCFTEATNIGFEQKFLICGQWFTVRGDTFGP